MKRLKTGMRVHVDAGKGRRVKETLQTGLIIKEKSWWRIFLSNSSSLLVEPVGYLCLKIQNLNSYYDCGCQFYVLKLQYRNH